jgi:hypothetical protein
MAGPVYNYVSNKFMLCIKTNKLAGLLVNPSTSTPEVMGSTNWNPHFCFIFNDFSAYKPRLHETTVLAGPNYARLILTGHASGRPLHLWAISALCRALCATGRA